MAKKIGERVPGEYTKWLMNEYKKITSKWENTSKIKIYININVYKIGGVLE